MFRFPPDVRRPACLALLMFALALSACDSPSHDDAAPAPSNPIVEPAPSVPMPDPPSAPVVTPSPSTPEPPPAYPDLDPKLRPSSNFDLSHWKLTLPVDAAGGNDGVAIEIINLSGYTSEYFHTASDGGLIFRAMVNGATTKNSEYPRSELRQMLDLSSAAVNWSDSDHAILEADLKVDRVPATGRFIVGQIHAFNSPRPFLKLQYDSQSGKGTLSALINKTPASENSIRLPLATGIALREVFTYRIEVNKRKLLVSVNGEDPESYAIDASWQGAGMFFKAGVYLQAHGDSSTDFGQATFYRLSTTPDD